MITKMIALFFILCPSAVLAAGPASNSLITPDQYRGIAADRRAYRVGDTLTVIVVEAAQAEAQADTGANRQTQVQGSAQNWTGTHTLGLGIGGSTDGAGKTSRQGVLRAELSVRVTAVEPHGLLRVRGNQTITINGEQQKIAIKGLVREDDISADNTIESNRLSDASIEFVGKGDVSNSEKENVLYKVLNWLGLI